jgi:hypothetical protein
VYLPEIVFPAQGTPFGCYHRRHGALYNKDHLCFDFYRAISCKMMKMRKISWKSRSGSTTMMTAERGVALTSGSRAVSGRGSREKRRPIAAQQKQARSEILQTTYKPGECRILIPHFPSLITRPPRIHQVRLASPYPSLILQILFWPRSFADKNAGGLKKGAGRRAVLIPPSMPAECVVNTLTDAREI